MSQRIDSASRMIQRSGQDCRIHYIRTRKISLSRNEYRIEYYRPDWKTPLYDIKIV